MSEQITPAAITPLAPGPEVRAFEHAQQRVLDTFGVAAQSRYVQLQTPPLRVHLLDAGQGDPVVLIHGGNAVAVQLAPVMAALQGAFQVFAPDRPGCGLTDTFDYRGVSLREHAVQFVTSVLDVLDLPRATLVANSMGGYWALVFALAYPERVAKLVLVGEPAGSAPPRGPLPARPTYGQPTLDSIRADYAERLLAHIWYASFQTDLADTLASELRRHALIGVKAALETALSEELEVHRQPYRQQPLPAQLQRSGSYTRRVLTTHGFIPDLHIPKLRGGNGERTWQVLKRYHLAMPLVLDQALYVYTLGLSIRDLQETLYVLFGHLLSREAINRVTRAAQSPLEAWRTRRITDTPPILIVDGVWGQVLAPTGEMWTDQSGHERREMRGVEQVILTVMGVWEDGRHQIIHYQAAAAEDRAAWSDLLVALIGRGLDAAAVKMVVSDGTTGLPAALAEKLPKAQQQRCVVHKIRGLERAFCYRELTRIDPLTQEPLSYEAARRLRRQQLSTEAHAIFEAASRAEAEERLAQFRTKWGTLEPEVVRLLSKDVDLCLAFYQFDHALHALIRSTNLLERFFREFRTKSDEIGAFPNELSCLVVFHLIVIRVVSLFHVDSLWGDDGQQQLFNSPLVIGQAGFHRGCLGLPPPLPRMHPDRERLERTREIVDPVFPGA